MRKPKPVDFESRRAELEASENPFGVVILAHLDTVKTARSPGERFGRKLRLIRGRYERGFSREDVLELLRLLDWFLVLPPELETQLESEIEVYEQERQMPYITSFERIGRDRGREEGRQEEGRKMVLDVLTGQFGELPAELRERIERADPQWCRDLLARAFRARSVSDLLD